MVLNLQNTSATIIQYLQHGLYFIMQTYQKTFKILRKSIVRQKGSVYHILPIKRHEL